MLLKMRTIDSRQIHVHSERTRRTLAICSIKKTLDYVYSVDLKAIVDHVRSNVKTLMGSSNQMYASKVSRETLLNKELYQLA